MKKTILIACVSYFGNNRRIAGIFQEMAEHAGVPAEMVSLTDREKAPIEWDVLVLFAPVRAGRIVSPARRFALRSAAAGKSFALVISHVSELNTPLWSPLRSAVKLQSRLVSLGMQPVSDVTYIQLETPKGPPREGFEHLLKSLADGLSG
jgi:hypothetical protein